MINKQKTKEEKRSKEYGFVPETFSSIQFSPINPRQILNTTLYAEDVVQAFELVKLSKLNKFALSKKETSSNSQHISFNPLLPLAAMANICVMQRSDRSLLD